MTTTLYRFFDPDDVLLYVGIATSPVLRWRGHRNATQWWSLARTVTLEHFPTRQAAARAETEAIATEKPQFNRVGLNRARVPRGPAAYLEIAKEIATAIRTGQGIRVDQNGNRWLPSYAQLQEQHNVSYGSIRDALRQLRNEGWIHDGEQGVGVQVREDHPG